MLRKETKIVRRYPTYTEVKYYRKTKPKRRSVSRFERETGWTHWRFHLSLYVLAAFLICTLAGLKYSLTHSGVTVKSQVYAAQVAPTIKPTPSPSPTPLPPAKDWPEVVERIKELSSIYDFPVKVAVAQAALESDRGNSPLATQKHNFFGLNAVDWDPFNSAWSFDNAEQCIIEYMRLIKTQYQDAYANRSNPDLMLKMIKDDGYATDPDYVAKVEGTPEWSQF